MSELPRRCRLEHEIRTSDKTEQRVTFGLARKIQHDRTFVAVEGEKLQAPLRFRSTVQIRSFAASRTATGWFDFNHIRTEIAENHAGDFATVVGQVKNSVRAEHNEECHNEREKYRTLCASSLRPIPRF